MSSLRVALIGLSVLLQSCSGTKDRPPATSSATSGCGFSDRINPTSNAFGDFAQVNFGSRGQVDGPTSAIAIEPMERHHKMTMAEFHDPKSTIAVRVVNRTGYPLWLLSSGYGRAGLRVELLDAQGHRVTSPWAVMGDTRLCYREFDVLKANESRAVDVPIGGKYLVVPAGPLRATVAYSVVGERVPTPPAGVVPVFGDARSDEIVIDVVSN